MLPMLYYWPTAILLHMNDLPSKIDAQDCHANYISVLNKDHKLSEVKATIQTTLRQADLCFSRNGLQLNTENKKTNPLTVIIYSKKEHVRFFGLYLQGDLK